MKRHTRYLRPALLVMLVTVTGAPTAAQTDPPDLNPFRTGLEGSPDPIEQIPELFDPDAQPQYTVTIPFERPELPWPMPLPASQLQPPEPFLPAYLRADGTLERRLGQDDALSALEVTAIAGGTQAVANLRIGPFNLIARPGEQLPGGIVVRDVSPSGITLERGDQQRRLEAP